PRRDRDARGLLDVAGNAQLAVAAKCDRPDVRALQAVLAHDLAARRCDRLARVRDLHPVDLRGVKQAANVVGQPEADAAVRRLTPPYAWNCGRAVMQRVTQHVHGRLFPRHQAALVPDELRRLQRHASTPAETVLVSTRSRPRERMLTLAASSFGRAALCRP